MAQRRPLVIIGGLASELPASDGLHLPNGVSIDTSGSAKLLTAASGQTWYVQRGDSSAELFGIKDETGTGVWTWGADKGLTFSAALTGAARAPLKLTNTDTSAGSSLNVTLAAGSSGAMNLTYYAPEYTAAAGAVGAGKLESTGSGGLIFADFANSGGFRWVFGQSYNSPMMELGTDRTLAVNAPGSSPGSSMVQVGSPGSLPGIVGFYGTASRNDIRFGNGSIQIGTAGSSTGSPVRFLTIVTSVVSPSADNVMALGAGAQRWTAVYAATGSINTSDARTKTAVAPLTDAEVAASKALAREIGTFQFLDAIAEKGASAARHHVGMTVQRVMEIMQAHGLDPFAYGFICHDTWDEQPALTDVATGDFVQDYRAAGDIYSFRPDELLLFMARGFDARLAALEGAS